MAKTVLVDEGFVLSYNNDSNKRTPFNVKKGDRLEWKRNGVRGGVNALVIGFSEQRPHHVFVENWFWDWSQPVKDRGKVWIKKRSVLRVKTDRQ